MPSEKVQEAQRLRNLGRYVEARKLFEEARGQEDSLSLATECTGLYMEQGRVAEALRTIDEALEKFRDVEEDRVSIGVAEMLRAMVTSARTATFTKPLQDAVKVFNKHLLEKSPSDYEKKSVMMLSGYVYLQSLAWTVGFDVGDVPSVPLDHLEAIFTHIIESHELSALSVVKLHSTLAEPQKKPFLLKKFLACDSVSVLNKADVHYRLAGFLREIDAPEEADRHLGTAQKLFESSGHATAPLTIQIERIGRNLSHKTSQSARKKLLAMKDQLDSLGDYFGVDQAIAALYQVADVDHDDDLRLELDKECIKRAEYGGYSQHWVLQEMMIVARWQKRQRTDVPESIRWLEVLFKSIDDKEVPRLRFLVAGDLAALYQSIKKDEKAAEWRQRAKESEAIPRCSRFLHGIDPFYNQLRDLSEAPPDQEAEDTALRRDLDQCVRDIEMERVHLNLNYLGIMKLTHYCDFYMTQLSFRSVDRVQTLVDICLEYAEPLLQRVPPAAAHQLRGDVLQVRARMKVTQSIDAGEQAIPILQGAIETYQQAIHCYTMGNSEWNTGSTYSLTGTCYQQIWNLEGQPPDAESFGLAIESYNRAQSIFARAPGVTVGVRQPSLLALIQLWVSGVMKKTTYSRMRWIPKLLGLPRLVKMLPSVLRLPRWLSVLKRIFYRDPRDDVAACFEQAEALFAEERHSLSALADRDSLLARQNLQRRGAVRDLYNRAMLFYACIGNNRRVWEWSQKAKARSVSDILGLGINLPVELRMRVKADPRAQELLALEKDLVAKSNDAPPDRQFMLRRDLAACRKRMARIPSLQEVLNLRSGEPVSLARLRALKNQIPKSQQTRRTFFADWIIFNNTIILLVVSDDSELYHVLDISMTLEQARDWTQQNILNESEDSEGTGSGRALDNPIDSFVALAELAPLVKPLLDITKEGDLLVLCPSGLLHHMPIHAAIIEGDPDDDIRTCKPLIERNPIVYASSLTTFEQTMRRATDRAHRSRSPSTQSGAIVAIFEDPTEYGWENVRERVHQTAAYLSTALSWPAARCGRSADKAAFRAACEADLVHFIGHFRYGTANVLEKGLVLAPTIPEDSEQRQAMDDPERLLSVSEIFDTSVLASHFSLIACGSASQTIEPGDEPLGIVTALLCAGATSAIGTLWPIRVDSGRIFSSIFYQDLFDDQQGETVGKNTVVDLAVAMQKAVKQMRADSELANPYHWAAFALYGSWLLVS